MPKRLLPRYTAGEEIAHAVTHGIGIVLSIVGLVVLVVQAVEHGRVRAIVGASVFGTTLILLYVASTLYHSIPLVQAKLVLRTLDHSAIYVLIAGTYTPVALVSLHGPWGWSLLAVVWGLAVFGISLRMTPWNHFRVLRIALYVVMGWLILVAARPLYDHIGRTGMLLFIVGGVFYTAGIGFYLWKRLRYHHAIWHAFVLAGSVLHYFAILMYVIRQ